MSSRPAAAALEVCVTARVSASEPAVVVAAATVRLAVVPAVMVAPVAVSLLLFAEVATSSASW